MSKRQCIRKTIDNIDSFTVDDLTISDDLTVTDDATVGGDLAVTNDATIGGDLTVTGTINLNTLSLDDGTVGDPSLSATAHPTTGLFWDGDDLVLTRAGVEYFRLTVIDLVNLNLLSIDAQITKPTTFYNAFATNDTIGNSAAGMHLQTRRRANGITWSSLDDNLEREPGWCFYGVRYHGGTTPSFFTIQGNQTQLLTNPGTRQNGQDVFLVNFGDNPYTAFLPGTETNPGLVPIRRDINGNNFGNGATGIWGTSGDDLNVSTAGTNRLSIKNNSITHGDQLTALVPHLYMQFLYSDNMGRDSSANAFDETIVVVGTGSIFEDLHDNREYVLDLTDNPTNSTAPVNYIDLSPHVGAFQNLTNFSLSVWINTDDTMLAGNIFGASNSTLPGDDLRLHFSTNAISAQLRIADSPVFTLTSGGTFNDGQWYHVVWLMGTGGTELYINGELVDSDPDTSSFLDVAALDTVLIGGNRDSGGLQWAYSGYIDNLAAYNRRLTTDEIRVAYYEHALHINDFNGSITSDGFKLNQNGVVTGAAIGTLTNLNDTVRSTGTQTITLPSSFLNPGKVFTILNTAAHTTTINASGSDTIDDASTTTINITASYEHVTLKSDGVSVWLVV